MDPRQVAQAQQLTQYLISKGATPQTAAAIVGNAYHESNLNPTASGDNGNSFGLYQFNKNGEQPAFNSYIQQTGANRNDPYVQTDFVWNRLQSPQYAKTLQTMNNSDDVAGATKAFMTDYENPAPSTANLTNRVNGAQAAYQAVQQANNTPSPIAFAAPQQGAQMPAGLLAGQPMTMASMPTSLLGQPTQMAGNNSLPAFAQPAIQAQAASIPSNTNPTPTAQNPSNFNYGGLVSGGLQMMANAQPAKPNMNLPVVLHRPQIQGNLFQGLLS